MKRSVGLRIQDILEAISACERYAPLSYSDDPTLSEVSAYAIERKLEIIGEASKHLPEDVTNQIPEVNWGAIRGTRNHLVHEYFGVDNEEIETIIGTDLVPLRNALLAYLDRNPEHRQ